MHALQVINCALQYESRCVHLAFCPLHLSTPPPQGPVPSTSPFNQEIDTFNGHRCWCVRYVYSSACTAFSTCYGWQSAFAPWRYLTKCSQGQHRFNVLIQVMLIHFFLIWLYVSTGTGAASKLGVLISTSTVVNFELSLPIGLFCICDRHEDSQESQEKFLLEKIFER